jgi:1-deoxy-D-xylulose-5-phosphate reductoisomerase
LIESNPEKFSAVFLSCNSNVEALADQIRKVNPSSVAVGKKCDGDQISREFPRLKVYVGEQGLVSAAKEADCDIMLNSLVGIAGLAPTVSALDADRPKGFSIALANKETLVTGGRLVMGKAAKAGVPIVPVDSEHSAIFQCLAGNSASDADHVILTGSGGPFRGFSEEQLKGVTVSEALAHPTWRMGSKITIDSATLMNKGFEVMEAKWLFSLPSGKVKVLIHPQSIVHSMVVFRDGAIMAQLGIPSMMVPIAYAFTHPGRIETGTQAADLADIGALTFRKPEGFQCTCLSLAQKALEDAEAGLDSTAVTLNGANEVLVELFLKGKIGFTDIASLLGKLVGGHEPKALDSLEEILAEDAIARLLALKAAQA